MRHARPRLIVCLLALTACDEPTAAPRPDDGAIATGPLTVAALAGGTDYYLEPVTIERTSGAQTVSIPLADRPWPYFMDPFTLHVVKSDSIRGRVRLGGAAVVNLGAIAVGDTTLRRLSSLTDTSTIEVTLTGSAGGTVTLWIVGRLQPAPAFALESPIRSEMLDSGVASFGVVPVRGRVCHPRYPITQVKLFANVLTITADGLCASFNTNATMPFGTGLVFLEATNSRGRKGYLVQSLLRADHWVTMNPDVTQTLNLLPGPFIVLAPAGVDDGSRADVDDLTTLIYRTLVTDSLADFPTVFYDGEPTQPSCGALRITRRGYRIERNGPVTHGSSPMSMALVDAGANLDLRFNQVVVPIRVLGFVKRACEPALVGVTNGTVTYGFGLVDVDIALAESGGTITASGPQPIAGMSQPGATIVFHRGSQLTTAQQEEVLNRIRDEFPAHLSNVLIGLGLAGRDSLGALLDRAVLAPGPGFDALGIETTDRIGSVTANASLLAVGFWPQVRVPEVRSIAPSPRGPLFVSAAADVDLATPALAVTSMNFYNAIFWGAWRAGWFDRLNLLDHPAAAELDGLRVRLRPMLPPTLQFAPQGNYFRVAWGDLRLDLRIDPSVWGDEDAGAEEVRARAWGHLYVDVALDYDPTTRRFSWAVTQLHSFTRVQLPSSFPTWIAEPALRAALEDLLWDVGPDLVVEAMSATPVPAAFPFSTPDASGVLRISPTDAVRAGIHLEMPGPLVTD